MTKEELRTQYVNQGWEVQPVADWRVVSQIEGKTKYDVNAVSPVNVFGTAQVVEDSTGAVAEGFWKDKDTTFTEDLRAYAQSLEAGQVFAVSLGEISDADEVAEVKVYKDDGSVQNFAVKRRNGTFEHVALI